MDISASGRGEDGAPSPHLPRRCRPRRSHLWGGCSAKCV